jgi:hypothetical protein
MLKLKKYLLLVLIIALAATTAVRSYQHWVAEKQLKRERAAHAREVLYLNGLIEGKVEREVTVPPSLTETAKVIKKAGATVASTAHIVYKQVEVPVPCDTPTVIDTTGTPTPPPTMTIQATNDILLSLDPLGKPWLKSNLSLDLNSTYFKYPIHVDMTPDNTTTTLSLSKNVQDALSYYNDRPSRLTLAIRPIKHWRAGWVVGAGIAIDPLQSHVGTAIFAGYGIQF